MLRPLCSYHFWLPWSLIYQKHFSHCSWEHRVDWMEPSHWFIKLEFFYLVATNTEGNIEESPNILHGTQNKKSTPVEINVVFGCLIRFTPCWHQGPSLCPQTTTHLPVHLWQQQQQALLALCGQNGERVLVDQRPQVGVHQDGVGSFHVNFSTLCSLQLPCKEPERTE